jgi:hypothetical protein
METNSDWKKITISQKNELFKEYIENELENNENNYQNHIIDNLIYSKNKLFLQTLKKNKNFFNNLNSEDIIIRNNKIYKIKVIEKNIDSLIYYSNNFNKLKQLKITDYKYRTIRNYVEYEKKDRDKNFKINNDNIFPKNNFENR